MQKLLSESQAAAFYHDEFVELQPRKLESLAARPLAGDSMVLDADSKAVTACVAAGLDAQVGDGLNPSPIGDEKLVCFNLILHHLVGGSDRITQSLQARALSAWRGTPRGIFVNEYIYDSWLGDASAWLIYRITSSRVLSAVGAAVARFAPSLKANVFGVGDRFRSHEGWKRMLADVGYRIEGYARGPEELVSLPRRLLLIRSRRKDCYPLVPTTNPSRRSP